MIPHLKEPVWKLGGKLQGRVSVRMASGTEVAGKVIDVEAVVVITAAADAEAAEAYIPGAREAIELSVGGESDGDGRRAPNWRPERAACNVVLTDADGVELYAGGALLRSAVLRTHEEGGVLTVSLRLLAGESSHVQALVEALGEGVTVVGTWPTAAVGAGAQVQQLPGGLPFPSQHGDDGSDVPEVAVGDLVVAHVPIGADDGVDVISGIAVSVGAAEVVLNYHLRDETSVTTVPIADVITVTAIAGPRGGDARAAIVDLREEAADGRDWSDVLDALADDGPDDEGRCRITRAVVSAVAEPLPAEV